MTFQFQKINTLAEVDFDGLFIESFPDFDINFLWQPEITTIELKKDFYKNQLEAAINGISPLIAPNESFMMYKVSQDNVDILLCAGFIEEDGISFRGHWYLSRPINGSRSWIHSSDMIANRKAFFTNAGVTSLVFPTHNSSLMYKTVKRNPVFPSVDEQEFSATKTVLRVNL